MLFFYSKKFSLLFITLFYFCTSHNNDKNNFLIQLISNSKTYQLIQDQTAEIIKNVVKQELKIETDELFLPKNSQAVTVYYIRLIIDKSTEDMFLKEFDKKQIFLDFKKPLVATIENDVAFFGEFNDELVILLNDHTNELANLHEKTKKLVHEINAHYYKTYNTNFYDIKTSEQYPFLPHIGIGRVRSHTLKSLIANQNNIEIVDHIKNRITKEVQDAIKKILSTHNDILSFNRISILKLPSRERVYEMRLKAKRLRKKLNNVS